MSLVTKIKEDIYLELENKKIWKIYTRKIIRDIISSYSENLKK
jgi:hypothetical protein